MNVSSLRPTPVSVSRPDFLLRLTLLVTLLIVTALAGFLTMKSYSLTSTEAHLAWLIHYDPVEASGQQITDRTPQQWLGFIRADVSLSWQRSQTEPLLTRLYTVPLNLWSLLVGDQTVALRLSSLLWSLLALAGAISWGRVLGGWRWGLLVAVLATALLIALRLVSQLLPQTAGLALILWAGALLTHNLRGRSAALLISVVGLGLIGLLVHTLPPPEPDLDWQGAVSAWVAARPADEPALIAFADDSPLAYYDRLTPVRYGIHFDIGWRDFSADEMGALVARLDGSAAIWMLAPLEAANTQHALTALAALGYFPADSTQVTNMVFYRLVRSP